MVYQPPPRQEHTYLDPDPLALTLGIYAYYLSINSRYPSRYVGYLYEKPFNPLSFSLRIRLLVARRLMGLTESVSNFGRGEDPVCFASQA